jgi:hypothetical protein
MSNRHEDGLPLDRAVDWDINGQPITYRDCIKSQCGPLALSYAERIQELALESIASLQDDLQHAEERGGEWKASFEQISQKNVSLQARLDAAEADVARWRHFLSLAGPDAPNPFWCLHVIPGERDRQADLAIEAARSAA